MVNQLRFWLYRNLVALLELLDFKKTEIIPRASRRQTGAVPAVLRGSPRHAHTWPP